MNYKNFAGSQKLLYGLRTEFSQKKYINYGLFYESRILNIYPNIYYGDTLHTATNFALYNSKALMISKCFYIEFKFLGQIIETPLLVPSFIINWNIFTEKYVQIFCFPSIFFSIANNFNIT